MLDWLTENRAVIEMVWGIVLLGLGTLYKFYFDAKGDYKLAMQNMGKALSNVAIEAGAIFPREILEIAAGGLWDTFLANIKIVNMFFDRGRFIDEACDLWYKQFEAEEVVTSSLARTGVPMR